MTLDGVADDVEELTLLRQDKSHRGLSKFKRLKHLWAGRVNQEMIEEISGLPELEILRIKNMSRQPRSAGPHQEANRQASGRKQVRHDGSAACRGRSKYCTWNSAFSP